MSTIKILEGELFIDERGKIASLNNFSFDEIERIYFIHHPKTAVVRGWHGHQFEKKWFYCVKGAFKVDMIKIKDWEQPDRCQEPETYYLSEEKSQIICVPEGYANCIKAKTKDAVLMVLSNVLFQDCHEDSWRYQPDYFVNYKSE